MKMAGLNFVHSFLCNGFSALCVSLYAPCDAKNAKSGKDDARAIVEANYQQPASTTSHVDSPQVHLTSAGTFEFVRCKSKGR